jgi:pullulanase
MAYIIGSRTIVGLKLTALSICVGLLACAGGIAGGVGGVAFAQSKVPPAAAQQTVTSLRAEVRGPKAIWVDVEAPADARPLSISNWRLTTAKGREIALAAVLPNTRRQSLLVPAEALDIRRVHYLEYVGSGLKVRVRFDGWFRTLYSAKPLGAVIAVDGKSTSFRVFAPRATAVTLYLYDGPDDTPAEARQTVAMRRDTDGVYEAILPGNLKGSYYDFTAHGPDDPGNQFYEQVPVHISDPYALVQMESFGKSRVWPNITPATPLKGGRPKMEDVIAYEVHVQDFTDLLPVADDLKGTFPAMAVTGLTNKRGEPIGFDYLVNLGINVVHLQPVQEFHHYPDGPWAAAFKDDPDMIAQAIATENYQWGYSTTHAFAIENKYRQKGTEPGAERKQFRDLVQAFHDKGIAVIIDIVPNHTGEDMRGGKVPLNFNGFDRQYYYRTNDAGEHIGPYGNEVKTEDRPMVQRWLIDQTKHFVDDFGIDGFRIDLAGQIDEQTMIKLRTALGDDVLIYGEAWIDVTDPYIRANPDWDWYKIDAPITFFQDDARDAFGGSPFTLENKATDRGFAGGNAGLRAAAMKGLANDYPQESKSPNQGLNYLDIHDNWALADRFAVRDWDGRQGVEAAPFKIAATLLFTSQGPIVMHGGTEIMRSKGSAALDDVVKFNADGEIRLKGRDDTYNQRAANQFQWETVGQQGGVNDYANMQAFWKGLIDFRLSSRGKVFRSASHIPGQYQWITPKNGALLGYVVGGDVLVLLNVGQTADAFKGVQLPAGNWRQIANNQAVDPIKGVGSAARAATGPQDFALGATSLQIWLRD